MRSTEARSGQVNFRSNAESNVSCFVWNQMGRGKAGTTHVIPEFVDVSGNQILLRNTRLFAAPNHRSVQIYSALSMFGSNQIGLAIT